MDIEWDEVLARCQPNVEGKVTFDECLKQCPTSIKYWIMYCQLFENDESSDSALSIYERAIRACPHADIWRLYLAFVRRRRSLDEVFAAYKDAIETIQHDWRAAFVFIEYVALLKRAYNVQNETSIAEKTSVLLPEDTNITQIVALWARERPTDPPLDHAQLAVLKEQIDLNLVRSVYQRALMAPHSALEQLWVGYEQFEQAFGQKHLCTRLLGEYSTKLYRSRGVYKELVKLYDGLDTCAHSVPPDRMPKGMLEKWRKVMEFEEGNPLSLDTSTLETRMCLLYQQCLLPMAFCTEFWYSFFAFLNLKKRYALAVKVLQAAVAKLPLDLFLRLSLAHYLETEAVKDIAASEAEFLKILEVFQNTNPPKLCPLGLINYINFIRRHKSVHEWRTTFMELTQTSVHTTWEVYVSQALTEYHVFNQTEAAARTFRCGLERFPQEPLLVNAFANFLISINDIRGARAQLSLSVREMIKQCQREKRVGSATEVKRLSGGLDILFEKWIRLETTFGSDAAATVQKLLDLKAELVKEAVEEGAAEDDVAVEIKPLKNTLREAVERFRFQHLVPSVTSGGDLLDWDRDNSRLNADGDLREQLRDHDRVAHLNAPSMNVVARPDVTKMLAFRPVHDMITQVKTDKMKTIPKCLQDLLALLPTKPLKGSAPDTDYLFTVLQTVALPDIPLKSFQKKGPQDRNLTGDAAGTNDAAEDGAFFSSRASVYRQRLITKRQKLETE
eukprot:GEMP01007729.1.p1 GENE.GEMP01007729.1~~GEMP01007729.1.p1  ORF type:complete len:744 (-),score=119.85 GEMP01007729.1:1397-3586(-)